MEQLEKVIRKSDLAAQSTNDFVKLVCRREELLPCEMKVEKEEIRFQYDVTEVTSFIHIKRERRDTILSSLIDCAKLLETSKEYQVNLHPDNLYYDMHFRVLLLDRDIYGRGEEGDDQEFLNQYKALIGFSLQKRYSYEDYLEGGLVLLTKNDFLSEIMNMTTVEELVGYLKEEYKKWKKIYQNTMVLVKKNRRNRCRRIMISLSVLLAIATTFLGYWLYWLKPYEKSVILANHAYIGKDYLQVVNAFKPVKMNRLDTYDKYILAYSYIQCESLTGEQKENIMNALSLETNRKVLEYWIYLGRLEIEKAEDIAQQISENDLLLYAYLKEKNMVEENTLLKGADKQNKLNSLKDKITKLSEELQESTKEKDTSNS